MQCLSCSATHDRLFCPSCVHQGVEQQRALKSQLTDQVNVVARRCEVQAQAVARWRILRAEVAAQERRVNDLRRQISALSEGISGANVARPPRLVVKDSTTTITVLQKRIRRVDQEQRAVDQRAVGARRVLIAEAAGLLGLSSGQIAGLPLPTPSEIEVHDTLVVNATLQHTCHLLDLFTRYLFVALPFEPVSSTDTRKGRIAIKPNVPFIHTTKFRDKSNTLWFGRKHIAASYTSYALLLHSIAYLAWTQGVEGIEETDMAGNLNALVHSASLGEKSHLGRMRSLGFSLDVNDVVARVMEEAGIQGEEGWALIEG